MAGSLTAAHLRARVAKLRQKKPDSNVIGIHSPEPWNGPSSLQVNGETVDVVCCRSPLEIREQLDQRSEQGRRLVVVTPLAEKDLGLDVLARLAKRQLEQVDSWSIVRDRFHAHIIDPRLGRYPWIADTLLAAIADASCPPAPGGVLSLDLAWGVVLQALGFDVDRPDILAVLEWASKPGNLDRYSAAPQELKTALRQRLEETAGPVSDALLSSIDAGRGADIVPIGLALQVTASGPEVELAQATVRLERIAGVEPISTQLASAWAATAEQFASAALEAKGLAAIRPWLVRLEAILREIGAEKYAGRSCFAESGSAARLEVLGKALEESLTSGSTTEAAQAAGAVRAHHLIRVDALASARVEMAERLSRWLGRAPAVYGSFPEAVADYKNEGSFVDWARSTLRGGDAAPGFSQACERLLAAAMERREEESRRFADLLRGWLEADSEDAALLPIENVLGEVVRPLATQHPVLLLVLDGMSTAVCQELQEDMLSDRWVLIRPAEDGPVAVTATVPSLTEVSRASLLCGKLAQGAQTSEKQGFAASDDLRAVSRAKRPPVLFHKGDLIDRSETDLADSVRAAIASPEQRVVAVVSNAVDDFLLKSDQIRVPWTISTIRLLEPILDTAAAAGRVVILTSDHGHVLEMGSNFRRGGEGDRWRIDDGRIEDGEVGLRGRRVVTATGSSVIAAWSERLRYGSKKNGYHGGASPQEMVVPLAVLAPPGLEVDGWQATAITYPDWWHAEAAEAGQPRLEVVRPPRMKAPPAKPQGDLFDLEPTAVVPPAARDRSWIDVLLASPTFAAQKTAAARIAPSDDTVRKFLLALAERGGKLTQDAMAQRLGLPPVRLQGTIAAVRTLLNVEGYDVVSVDQASDTIVLDQELLRVQFEVDG